MRAKSYGMGGCIPLKLSREMTADEGIIKAFTGLSAQGRQGLIDAASAASPGWDMGVRMNGALDSGGVFEPRAYV